MYVQPDVQLFSRCSTIPPGKAETHRGRYTKAPSTSLNFDAFVRTKTARLHSAFTRATSESDGCRGSLVTAEYTVVHTLSAAQRAWSACTTQGSDWRHVHIVFLPASWPLIGHIHIPLWRLFAHAHHSPLSKYSAALIRLIVLPLSLEEVLPRQTSEYHRRSSSPSRASYTGFRRKRLCYC